MELNATPSSPLLSALDDPEFLPWLLERLLHEQLFADQWVQQVVGKIETRTAPTTEVESHQPARIANSKIAASNRISRLCNTLSEPHKTLVAIVKDLQISINLATESFLTADKSALNGSSTTAFYSRHNRDAATLFTARRIVEDLLLSTSTVDRMLVRSTACGRRLSGLCRLLADRLANTDVDQLPHIHFFAHSLHEMLVRFDEHLSFQLINWNYDDALGRLRIAIDKFQSIVVVQLQAFVNEWRMLHQQVIAKCLSDQHTSSATVSVRHIRSDFKPKGYLLPIPLREKRRIVQQSFVNRRPMTNVPGVIDRQKKLKELHYTSFGSLTTTADRIESRWKELLSSEVQQLLLSSTQPTAHVSQHSHVPSKDAETNTSDRYSSWLRTARDPANRLAQKIVENAVNLIIQDIDDACDQIVENICAEEFER